MVTREAWKTGDARQNLLLLLLKDGRHPLSTCSARADVCQDSVADCVADSDFTVSRSVSVSESEELNGTGSDTATASRGQSRLDKREVSSHSLKSRDSGIESTNMPRPYTQSSRRPYPQSSRRPYTQSSQHQMGRGSSAVQDVVEVLKLDSCKRRYAKLDRETRTEVILSHQKTKQQKVADYYKMLEEKRDREMDKATRKRQAMQRFKTAMWKVIWIIRWKLCMICISMDSMTMTAMEIDWHTRNTDAADSLFNKSNFTRQKNSAKVPDWGKKLLRKPVEWRNEAECNKLHALLRPLVSFERFTEKIQMAMCKAVRYEFVDAKRIILRRGQHGHCFYFIYSGSVFVNVEEKDGDGQTFVRTKSVLHAGDSFGETALLRDSLRTATITCREDTELLTVDKQLFSTICPQIFEQELEIRTDFIRSLSMFLPSLISDDDIQQLAFEGQIKQYKSDKVIVVDSSIDEWIYICMEGCCRIIKFLTIDTNNQTPTIITSDSDDSPLVATAYSRAKSNINPSLTLNKSQTQQKMKKQLQDPSLKRSMSKVKMLSSLTMEWLEAHKQVEAMKQQKRQEELEKNNHISGIKSISELISVKIAQAKHNKQEMVAVEVGTIKPTEIFDLYAIIRQSSEATETGSKLALVSSGAKMLRIRRSAFFRILSFEAHEYIKAITSDNRYVPEAELYNRYRNMHRWNCYKSKTIAEIMDNKRLKPAQSTALDLLQERRDKEAMLLQILKVKDQTEKKSQTDNKIVERRQLFQLELENAFKDVQENVRRELIIQKAAQLKNQVPLLSTRRLRRRESAKGSLPNLVDRLLTQQQVMNTKRHSDTPHTRIFV